MFGIISALCTVIPKDFAAWSAPFCVFVSCWFHYPPRTLSLRSGRPLSLHIQSVFKPAWFLPLKYGLYPWFPNCTEALQDIAANSQGLRGIDVLWTASWGIHSFNTTSFGSFLWSHIFLELYFSGSWDEKPASHKITVEEIQVMVFNQLQHWRRYTGTSRH